MGQDLYLCVSVCELVVSYDWVLKSLPWVEKVSAEDMVVCDQIRFPPPSICSAEEDPVELQDSADSSKAPSRPPWWLPDLTFYLRVTKFLSVTWTFQISPWRAHPNLVMQPRIIEHP